MLDGLERNYAYFFEDDLLKEIQEVGKLKQVSEGSIIMDIGDAQEILDLENGAGELLGFSNNEMYYNDEVSKMAEQFNSAIKNSKDEFRKRIQKKNSNDEDKEKRKRRN